MSNSIKLSENYGVNPTISKGVYPTGRHVVVKREAVNVGGDKFLMIDKEFKTMFRIDWRK